MHRRLTSSRKPWWSGTYHGDIHRLLQGEIVRSDVIEFLSALKKECADVVFVDPPFNLGKVYGRRSRKRDKLGDKEYTEFMEDVLMKCVEILKPGGSLFLYHIPLWANRLSGMIDGPLLFRHWIAISMKNGFARNQRLYPAHYALLYYSKGEPSNFQRPKIPIARCRECDAVIKDYGGYREYMKDGVNLSDFWDDLSPVRHKNRKHRVANELPLQIPQRALQISGLPGGVLVDPFLGTGSSAVAAMSLGMSFVGCERDAGSVRAAIERLLAVKQCKRGF